ncbi:arylsulfatase I-like [Glandiceps talaboti]
MMRPAKVLSLSLWVLVFLVVFRVLLLYRDKQTSNESTIRIMKGETNSERYKPPPPPPHIVFIMADDYGWHDVGYHGGIAKTPNIDQLAHEGVKLENYYVSSWCVPSRINLMTGRYVSHTGYSKEECEFMDIRETTLAEKLRQAGYYTALVGKWHLGGFDNPKCNPPQRGFQSFLGYLGGSQHYYKHRRGFYGNAKYDFWANNSMVGPQYDGVYSTFVFATEAQRIIENHNADKPLFLYLSFQAVHIPLLVPMQYEGRYNSTIENDDRRTHAGMTTCMDEAIGNVTETLKQTGLWDNTVLIFSSDNGGTPYGGGNNWPLRGQKGLYYEGGVKAIGFVNSPLLPKPVRGTINNELIHMTDWFKTLLYLAKGNWNGTRPLDGFNQWETISNQKKTKRREMLLELNPGAGFGSNEIVDRYFDEMPVAAIRVGPWKLVTGYKAYVGEWIGPPELGFTKAEPCTHTSVELFNIDKDPEERKNLAEMEKDKVDELLQILYNHSKTMDMSMTFG